MLGLVWHFSTPAYRSLTGPPGFSAPFCELSRVSDFVLVHSPLVRTSSWEPTARELRLRGFNVEVPDLVSESGAVPPWRDWPPLLSATIMPDAAPILVGRSAAGALIAAMAARIAARGLIFVDAQIPHAQGPTAPVEASFLTYIDTLVLPGGMLPPWSQWWPPDVMEVVIPDATLRKSFEAGLPRLPRAWFDDSFDLAPWPDVQAGYVQTSKAYDEHAAEAERRGWPLVRLSGTHLHPFLVPGETADAIEQVSAQFPNSPSCLIHL